MSVNSWHRITTGGGFNPCFYQQSRLRLSFGKNKFDKWKPGRSNKKIRRAFKINTIYGYKELVEDMEEDGNVKEAEELERLIERLENKYE